MYGIYTINTTIGTSFCLGFHAAPDLVVQAAYAKLPPLEDVPLEDIVMTSVVDKPKYVFEVYITWQGWKNVVGFFFGCQQLPTVFFLTPLNCTKKNKKQNWKNWEVETTFDFFRIFFQIWICKCILLLGWNDPVAFNDFWRERMGTFPPTLRPSYATSPGCYTTGKAWRRGKLRVRWSSFCGEGILPKVMDLGKVNKTVSEIAKMMVKIGGKILPSGIGKIGTVPTWERSHPSPTNKAFLSRWFCFSPDGIC